VFETRKPDAQRGGRGHGKRHTTAAVNGGLVENWFRVTEGDDNEGVVRGAPSCSRKDGAKLTSTSTLRFRSQRSCARLRDAGFGERLCGTPPTDQGRSTCFIAPT